MNPFVPELAPLMLYRTSGSVWAVVMAGALGVLASLAGLKRSRGYSIGCSGVALWAIARIHGVPLDVFLVAALPHFALPAARAFDETAVGAAGLLQYVWWVFWAPPPELPDVHVAFLAALAFVYVANAGDWPAAVLRAGMAVLWVAFPRAVHAASGAVLLSSASVVSAAFSKPAEPIVVVLAGTLAGPLLGDWAHVVIAGLGGACWVFRI
jgi:hypothetical protein